MILSLVIDHKNKIDSYSFFPVKNSISCPPHLWFLCITSSLRRKHEVLFFTESLQAFPEIDKTKRWVCGENWMWLHPRSLSAISHTYELNLDSFLCFKNALTTFK